jgi:hypothetical protein
MGNRPVHWLDKDPYLKNAALTGDFLPNVLIIGKASHPLTVMIHSLESRCVALEKLVGEMVATLTLPRNQDALKDLPKEFHELLLIWKARWEQIKEGTK